MCIYLHQAVDLLHMKHACLVVFPGSTETWIKDCPSHVRGGLQASYLTGIEGALLG